MTGGRGNLKSGLRWLRYTYTLLMSSMTEAGHVRDGQEVLDYLEGQGQFADRTRHPLPQLLLLDLNMPRLDGFDVLAWVREQPGLNNVLIVIFSSSDEPRDINRAYGLGASSYLVKPHSMAELTALVGRFKKYWLEPGKDHGRKAA